MKSESLKHLEPSGPHRACYVTSLSLPFAQRSVFSYYIQKCKLIVKVGKEKGRIKFAFTPFTKMVCVCPVYNVELEYNFIYPFATLNTTNKIALSVLKEKIRVSF
jgi:hypothetical protein